MPLTAGLYCNRPRLQPERDAHVRFFTTRGEHPRFNGDLSHVMLDYFTLAHEVVGGVDHVQFAA